MTKILLILFLIPLLITGCSTPPQSEAGTMRFMLRDDYISSWQENRGGVTVHLNDEGGRKLRTVTHYHTGYPLEIYANRCLIQKEPITGAAEKPELTLKVSGDVKDRLMTNLPPHKKTS